MKYNEWEPYYKKILNDFKFKEEEDIKSAEILDQILNDKCQKQLDFLKEKIQGKEVVIFGAGPSIIESIIMHREIIDKKTTISADGATTALKELGILPDIITTDLDGVISDIIQANTKKSFIVLHAHGDNIEKIKKYSEKFNKNLIGTTQADPKKFKNLYNFGGFTDGDRAIFLSEHLKAEKIHLIGFDFNDEIGKYSYTKPYNIENKKMKLKWCKKLIDILQKKHQNIYY